MPSPKAVIISGNPKPASRLTGLIHYVRDRLSAASAFGGQVDVAALPAEDLIRARFDSPAVAEAHALVAAADAVIIASPVYKASYTGVLKTYLDLLPQKGLADKIVTPLFIGGTIAHLLAIDYALKPVLAALGAKRFTTGVYAVDTQVVRTETPEGQPRFELDPELRERLDAALDELLSQLGVDLHVET